MKILVDADACPVKNIILKIAKQYGIRVIMLIDTSHRLNDGYSEIVTVDQARDSVDFALIQRTSPGDLVVTQDFGVAAMALAKGARALNQNGLIFDDSNMDGLLYERHISQKIRRSGGRTSNAPRRNRQDDERFESAFRSLLTQAVPVPETGRNNRAKHPQNNLG
ncbi:MAG TPA: YaiI/YqxD family protein [Clostridia bacterium]|nr:YaiI/YqxD family protein [Clostridia bacterium]